MNRAVDLDDAVSIHGDEEFEIEKNQEEKKIEEQKQEGRKLFEINSVINSLINSFNLSIYLFLHVAFCT